MEKAGERGLSIIIPRNSTREGKEGKSKKVRMRRDGEGGKEAASQRRHVGGTDDVPRGGGRQWIGQWRRGGRFRNIPRKEAQVAISFLRRQMKGASKQTAKR